MRWFCTAIEYIPSICKCKSVIVQGKMIIITYTHRRISSVKCTSSEFSSTLVWTKRHSVCCIWHGCNVMEVKKNCLSAMEMPATCREGERWRGERHRANPAVIQKTNVSTTQLGLLPPAIRNFSTPEHDYTARALRCRRRRSFLLLSLSLTPLLVYNNFSMNSARLLCVFYRASALSTTHIYGMRSIVKEARKKICGDWTEESQSRCWCRSNSSGSSSTRKLHRAQRGYHAFRFRHSFSRRPIAIYGRITNSNSLNRWACARVRAHIFTHE